jgi:hypothetical protein
VQACECSTGRRQCRWLLGRLWARRHLFPRLHHGSAGADLSHFTYYNIPLLETGRPTIGANQYGIFIQAFGLIRWRAIDRIDLAEIAERAMTVHELQISLSAPLASALVVDWRKQPKYRLLMRQPWRMNHNNMVRVKLEPFDQPPDAIHRTFLRMWRYYRS